MRTTAKPVVEAIRKHIMDEFERQAVDNTYYKEPDEPEQTAIEMLVGQIDYMKHNDRTTYQTAIDWVEGGSLLIYHYEVKDFLNDLGINPTGKEYSDEKSWKLYCHLVAREMTKLYEGAK